MMLFASCPPGGSCSISAQLRWGFSSPYLQSVWGISLSSLLFVTRGFWLRNIPHIQCRVAKCDNSCLCKRVTQPIGQIDVKITQPLIWDGRHCSGDEGLWIGGRADQVCIFKTGVEFELLLDVGFYWPIPWGRCRKGSFNRISGLYDI